MEPLADLADSVIDVDLGTSQAQGGFTDHGDAVFFLSTLEASIFRISYLIRVTIIEHLGNEVIGVFLVIS
jgi:hypothetical protein